MNIKRIFTYLAIAAACVLGAVESSTAAMITVVTFGGSPAGSVTGVNNGLALATTTITATDALVTISDYAGGGAPFSAYFNLSATSLAPGNADVTAVPGLVIQHFGGSFSFNSSLLLAGTNYLSGTFVDATVGIIGSSGLTMTATASTYFSDLLLVSIPGSFNLSFSTLSPPVSVFNKSIGSFTAAVSGTMDATKASNIPLVPEPASMAIWGLGALGLAVARMRRRKLVG